MRARFVEPAATEIESADPTQNARLALLIGGIARKDERQAEVSARRFDLPRRAERVAADLFSRARTPLLSSGIEITLKASSTVTRCGPRRCSPADAPLRAPTAASAARLSIAR
jgi:hypothetical protein